jgi:hypothetical protein
MDKKSPEINQLVLAGRRESKNRNFYENRINIFNNKIATII